ncbi:MAG: NADH:ubiquinone reductase ((+)-transporting) subunit [Bacteroidota bacterium]|jgi:Na+-transporting NADH:ubiquinone oxidoreductase subunit C
MNTNSNIYTILYASGLVLTVAILLAVVAVLLQPFQDRNVVIEKKQNILTSIGVITTPENADSIYSATIKDDFVIDSTGQRKEGKGFDVEMVEEVAKKGSERKLPVFIAQVSDGTTKTIIPLRGKGLWGPIWGYVSLDADQSTIYGASFDHKGETPGLGADINQPFFQDQFKGKTLFEGDKFNSIIVYKGGKGSASVAGDLTHGVDAISGGTITSKGLQAMLLDCLSPYVTYLKTNKK